MLKFYFSILYNFFFNYATPSNLTNVWNFGVLAFSLLISQMISGLLLSMYYVPNEELAFYFTEYLMRDTYFGWYIRYLHSNGASLFFFFTFLHLFRSLYYFSFIQPKLASWNTGVIVLVLMIIAAFTGYVLPWGQMSFWACTVITNLASAVPIIGSLITVVVWGSYAVSTYTLNRFYTIHFILPFIILFIVIVHFIFLHHVGSSNNMKVDNKNDKIPFHPYYTIKDVLVLITIIFLYLTIINVTPNYLSHSDNYIEADPLSTPAHIVPEWYFLPFYAILRSVPDKLGGILTLAASIIILFIFPYFVKSFYKDNIWSATRFDFMNAADVKFYMLITKRTCPTLQKYLFWLFVIDFIGLSYIGMKPVEEPYLLFGLIFTMGYFAYFLSSLYIHSFQLWLDLMKKFNKEFKWDIRAIKFTYNIYKFIVKIIVISKKTAIYIWIQIKIIKNVLYSDLNKAFTILSKYIKSFVFIKFLRKKIRKFNSVCAEKWEEFVEWLHGG